MNSGFDNFRNLHNGNFNDPVQWDISLLKNEQIMLQPTHEKYLKEREAFRWVARKAEKVDLLDYVSRIKYGCKEMKHNGVQECAP